MTWKEKLSLKIDERHHFSTSKQYLNFMFVNTVIVYVTEHRYYKFMVCGSVHLQIFK
jgi:hypothetical protein